MAAPHPRKVVVGSGWWSDQVPHAWSVGSRDTHTPAFFDLWYSLVTKYLAPHRIVVTDSHSPVKPHHAVRSRLVWIELDDNYGHPNDLRVGRLPPKLSGYTRSVYVGATFALACDADYYVYVEQDCVIYGEGLLDTIIAGMDHPIALGPRTEGGVNIEGGLAAPMYQTSLIVVRGNALERFISAILGSPDGDGATPPEVRFARDLAPFSLLPVPFGRSRPLDFTEPQFYAQHLTHDELAAFVALAGEEAARPGAERSTLDQLCISHPALREVVMAAERRHPVAATFPEALDGQLDRLLAWALFRGVHEDALLEEISSEVAELVGARIPRDGRPAPEPSAVHIVTLPSFHESFRACAASLHQGFIRSGVPTQLHEDVVPAELPRLARDTDGIVHVMGQGDVSTLTASGARNWVLTIHGAADHVLLPDLHPPAPPAYVDLAQRSHDVPHVICPTFSARREVRIAYGFASDAVDPIPHLFDLAAFHPVGGRRKAPPYFLLVSEYQPKKNYAAVLEAFALLADRLGADCPRLALAGTPNEPLMQLVNDTSRRWPALRHRVDLLGHVDDLAPVYRGALALVSMSHHEGFGMPYIEAALCGVPVIGPKRSIRAAPWASQPTRELLGGAAILVDPCRPRDLAAHMEILASDDRLRWEAGERCRARALAYVDPAYVVARYLHVYGRVLTRSANSRHGS